MWRRDAFIVAAIDHREDRLFTSCTNTAPRCHKEKEHCGRGIVIVYFQDLKAIKALSALANALTAALAAFGGRTPFWNGTIAAGAAAGAANAHGAATKPAGRAARRAAANAY